MALKKVIQSAAGVVSITRMNHVITFAATLLYLACFSASVFAQSTNEKPSYFDGFESENSLTGGPECIGGGASQDTGSQLHVGNPINAHTFNLHRAVLDLDASAVGQLDLNLVRAYNSRFDMRHFLSGPHVLFDAEASNGPQGPTEVDVPFAVFGPSGWTHTYNLHLYEVDTRLILFDGDGRISIFEREPTAANPNAQVFQVIKSSTRDTIIRPEQAMPSEMVLHRENGMTVVFAVTSYNHYAPVRIVDSAGESIEFEYYNAQQHGSILAGRLMRVIDGAGRELVFGYNEDTVVKYLPEHDPGHPEYTGPESVYIDDEEELLIVQDPFDSSGPGTENIRTPNPPVLTSVTHSDGRVVRYTYGQYGFGWVSGIEPLYLRRVTIEDSSASPSSEVFVSRYDYMYQGGSVRLESAYDRNGPANYPAVRYEYLGAVRGASVGDWMEWDGGAGHEGAVSRELNAVTDALIMQLTWPADEDEYSVRMISRPSNEFPGTTVSRKALYLRPEDTALHPSFRLPNNNMPVAIQEFGSELPLIIEYKDYGIALPGTGNEGFYSTRQATNRTDRLGREWEYLWEYDFQSDDDYSPDKAPLRGRVSPDGASEYWEYLPHDDDRIPPWLVKASTDSLGRETAYEYLVYDNVQTGLMSTITYPDNTTDEWTYDYELDPVPVSAQGLITSHKDRNGHVTTYEYDFGSPLNGASKGWVSEITITDAENRVTVTEYDILGRVVAVTRPGGRVTEYAYNVFGDVTGEILPDGSTITREYDVWLGSEIGSEYLDPSGSDHHPRSRGNVTREVHAPASGKPGVTVERLYQYDHYNRMIAERLITGTGAGEYEETLYSYAIESMAGEHPPGEGGGSCCGGRTMVRRMTDPLGRITRYFYDEEDRLVTIERPDPKEDDPQQSEPTYEHFEYDLEGQLLARVDAESARTEFDFDVMGRRFMEWRQNDSNEGEPDHLVLMRHDPAGRLLERAEYIVPPSTQQELDDLDDYRSDYYDYSMLSGTETPPSPPAYPGTVGDDYRLTTYTYDVDNDWLLSVTNGEGETTEYAYDDVGNVIEIKDPLNRVTATEYDKINRVVKVTFPEVDSIAATQEWEYDANDNWVKFTNEEGEEERSDFDDLGRMKKFTNNADEVVEYVYDHRGNLVAMTDYPDGYGGDPPIEGRVTVYEYDAADRLTREERPGDMVVKHEYDKAGNLIAMIDYPKGTAEAGRRTEFEYDFLDRLVKIIHPENDADPPVAEIEEMEYDLVGRVIFRSNRHDPSETSPEGVITVYDALGRAVLMIDQLAYETAYTYDGLGRLTRIKDDTEAVTEYEYDLADRQTKITYAKGMVDPPIESVESFEYDDAGNRTKVVHRDETETTFVYNARNWMISSTAEELDLGPEVTSTDTFKYDKVGRRIEADSERFGNTVTFEYDPAGRLEKETIEFDDTIITLPTTYFYDQAGQVIEMHYPAGEKVKYTYTARGEIEDVKLKLSGVMGDWALIASHEYDMAGQLKKQVFGNDVETDYSYDASGRIQEIGYQIPVASVLTDFLRLSYARNPAGDLVERMDAETGRMEVYEHDAARRLRSMQRTHSQQALYQRHWELDAVGNWLGLYDTFDSPDQNNLIESRDHNPLHAITTRNGAPANPSHDDRGRLTLDGDGLEFVWDGRDRLIQVRVAGAGLIESYRYDALGRRVRRDRPNPLSGEPDFQTGATLFAYAGLRCVEERSWADGPPTESGGGLGGGPLGPPHPPELRAIYTFGAYLDEPLHMERWVASFFECSRFFLHRDHNYNIVAATSTDGQDPIVIELMEYDAYGMPTSYDEAWDNPKPGRSRIHNPHLFTGQRWDAATGLYYYKARYMHPGLGRFVSPDPLGYVDGMSLYQYVKGNPISYRDALGLKVPYSDEDATNLLQHMYELCDSMASRCPADSKCTSTRCKQEAAMIMSRYVDAVNWLRDKHRNNNSWAYCSETSQRVDEFIAPGTHGGPPPDYQYNCWKSGPVTRGNPEFFGHALTLVGHSCDDNPNIELDPYKWTIRKSNHHLLFPRWRPWNARKQHSPEPGSPWEEYIPPYIPMPDLGPEYGPLR